MKKDIKKKSKIQKKNFTFSTFRFFFTLFFLFFFFRLSHFLFLLFCFCPFFFKMLNSLWNKNTSLNKAPLPCRSNLLLTKRVSFCLEKELKSFRNHVGETGHEMKFCKKGMVQICRAKRVAWRSKGSKPQQVCDVTAQERMENSWLCCARRQVAGKEEEASPCLVGHMRGERPAGQRVAPCGKAKQMKQHAKLKGLLSLACAGERKKKNWLAIGSVARPTCAGEEESPAGLGPALCLGCWSLGLWPGLRPGLPLGLKKNIDKIKVIIIIK